MAADVNEIKELKQFRQSKHGQEIFEIAAESLFISDYLIDPMGDGVSYEQVTPKTVGALTNAPMISDGENVFGFMDYQIENFLDSLIEEKEVVWQKA